jgi:CelD/BcsL family acetyltransferase involved in cellulose biosynthesis
MGEPVSQYGDVLIDHEEDTEAILSAAWRLISTELGADVIQLRKVRADSAVTPLLPRIGATAAERLAAASLDLKSAATFDAYEQRYSSGARRNRKRQRRRLEERGRIDLVSYAEGLEARTLARAALKLKRAWLAERALVSAAFADDRLDAFFGDVTEARTRPAGCHVLALTCDGEPAALEIGLSCKGRAAIHVIVYDRAFEKAAAGSLLMEDSIRRAFGSGIETYDLLAPADPYKLDWSDTLTEVCDWTVPLTLSGRVYTHLYLDFVRATGKRVLAALPVRLRRVVAARAAAL